MNWKHPVNHLEFIGPGAILMASSVFGVVATILTVVPISIAIDQLYFKTSLMGIVVSLFILFRTKLGTALFFTLIIPYGYYVYRVIDTYGLTGSLISTTVMFTYVLIANGRRQLHYHATQQKNAQSGPGE